MQAPQPASAKISCRLSEQQQMKRPRITCVFGGGIAPDVANSLKNKWITHRLKIKSIDTGNEGLAPRALIEKIAARLTNGSHLMLFIHGVAPQATNNHKHHLRINALPEGGESTLTFLERVVARAKQLHPDQMRSHLPLPVIHILSCFSGSLSDELRPDSHLWRSAHFVVYSSKKFTYPDYYGAAMDAAASYISDCAQRGEAVNPLRLFFLAGSRSGDCLRLLGGDLQAPLILHAPKLASDLEENRLDHRLEAGPGDRTDFYLSAIETVHGKRDLTETLPEAIAELLQTRIGRRDLQSVAQLLSDYSGLINQRSRTGVPPLNIAILEGFEPIIDLLLESGANLRCTDAIGVGPTITALLAEDYRMLAKLLAKGANPNETNMYGSSALFVAVTQRSTLAAELLLEYGADINYSDNHDTALTLAVNKGDPTMVRLLLKNGAGRASGLSNELATAAVQNNQVEIGELLYRALSGMPIV